MCRLSPTRLYKRRAGRRSPPSACPEEKGGPVFQGASICLQACLRERCAYPSLAAAAARRSISSQLPDSINSVGATHDPPTQATLARRK